MTKLFKRKKEYMKFGWIRAINVKNKNWMALLIEYRVNWFLNIFLKETLSFSSLVFKLFQFRNHYAITLRIQLIQEL